MKNRTLIFYTAALLWTSIFLGFLLPYFMSMKSDSGVIIALVVIAAHFLTVVLVINKKLFSKNGEKNEIK